MAENERVYLVGGTKMSQNIQTHWLVEERHTVVVSDSFGEPPLNAMKRALAMRARIAIVNLRKEQKTKSGLTGEEVVVQLRTAAPRVVIVSFNEDGEDPDSQIPGVDLHVQKTRDTESYRTLAATITTIPPKIIRVEVRRQHQGEVVL